MNNNKKLLLILFILLTTFLVIIGCQKKAINIKLPKDFAKTILNNNKQYINKEIIYEDYFDPSIGDDFQINKSQVWKILINEKGDWKKTVISIPENVEKLKGGSFNARIKNSRFDFDINTKQLNINRVTEETKDPAQFYYVASLVAKALNNDKTKVKAVQSMLKRGVYWIISARLENPNNSEPSNKTQKIKIEDHYWVDKSNGRVYGFVQYIDGHVAQSYKIKSIKNVKVSQSQVSTKVPLNAKITHDQETDPER